MGRRDFPIQQGSFSKAQSWPKWSREHSLGNELVLCHPFHYLHHTEAAVSLRCSIPELPFQYPEIIPIPSWSTRPARKSWREPLHWASCSLRTWRNQSPLSKSAVRIIDTLPGVQISSSPSQTQTEQEFRGCSQARPFFQAFFSTSSSFSLLLAQSRGDHLLLTQAPCQHQALHMNGNTL